MLRFVLFPALLAALVVGSWANAQVRAIDPPDPAEVLEEQLRGPYYSVSGRGQRPIVDRVPEQILSGTGFYFTNVRYFKGVGKILTDLEDQTLYATEKDQLLGQSSLGADDLKDWQPIRITEKTNLTGFWGKAWNETLQVWVLTLVDKPLYRFIGDEAPGEVNGKGAGWYPLEVLG